MLTCLVLTVECAIAKSIARPVSFDDTPTSWTAKLARNTLTTFFLTGTIALKTIQARATFILAVRTVTCQIVDFALVDHTGRVRTGAKILLRALEAVLAASTWLVTFGYSWPKGYQKSEARAGQLGYEILCALGASNVLKMLKRREFKTTH